MKLFFPGGLFCDILTKTFDLTSVAIGLTSNENVLSSQTAGKPLRRISAFWSLVMNMALPPCLNRSDWRTLYRAAILETNKNILPQRVSEAEEAVKERGREIFYGHGTPEEKEALEDALYALRAFRTAWQHAAAA
jgi:hypothetical protein